MQGQDTKIEIINFDLYHKGKIGINANLITAEGLALAFF